MKKIIMILTIVFSMSAIANNYKTVEETSAPVAEGTPSTETTPDYRSGADIRSTDAYHQKRHEGCHPSDKHCKNMDKNHSENVEFLD